VRAHIKHPTAHQASRGVRFEIVVMQTEELEPTRKQVAAMLRVAKKTMPGTRKWQDRLLIDDRNATGTSLMGWLRAYFPHLVRQP
jgi:hypothetical protein